MKHDRNFPWPEANVQILRVLWADGLSASQIAVRMNKAPINAGLTRNAVIAKVHRLGLPKRRTLANGARKRMVKADKPRPLQVKPRAPTEPSAHRLRGAQPSETNIPFIQSKHHIHCQMFVSDESGPDGLVCGKRATVGAWCGECARAIYVREAA